MPDNPTYGDINFKGLDTTQYRYIEFNGFNSLTDLGLVINGLAPLSPVTPKILTKEIPLADGLIDVSRVDGALHYQSREITYDFLFINEKSKHYGQTIATEDYINNAINNIYQWLLSASSIDLYDSTYGNYKFTNASCVGIEPKRTIIGDDFVTVLSVTFRMDPWLVSKTGTRVEFAQFVDRARITTGQQSVCHFYDNNKFWVNDNVSSVKTTKMEPHKYHLHFKPTDYQGLIGFSLITMTTYEQGFTKIDHTVITSPNTHEMAAVPPHGPYTYFWSNLGDGAIEIDIYTTQDSVDDWTDENPFYEGVIWGVITQYTVPDQTHYHFDVFTKSSNVTMELNDNPSLSFDYHTFTLPVQSINVIEIFNDNYDGFYKLYYDSTTRRLM